MASIIVTEKQGLPGPTPTVTWNDTQIIVDGVPGPDLKGDTGVTTRQLMIGAKDTSALIQTGLMDTFESSKWTGTIVGWSIDSDVATTAQIQVLKDGASISGANPITLTAGQYAESTTLTGWTTAVTKGQRFTLNVLSNTAAQTLIVTIYMEQANA